SWFSSGWAKRIRTALSISNYLKPDLQRRDDFQFFIERHCGYSDCGHDFDPIRRRFECAEGRDIDIGVCHCNRCLYKVGEKLLRKFGPRKPIVSFPKKVTN